MKKLGTHLIAEFYGCDARKISKVSYVKEAMEEAALKANATIVQSTFHQFNPYGVSGVVIIAESHLSIHSWPEYGYASIDVYTCGDHVDPWITLRHLEKSFGASDIEVMELPRGRESKIKIKNIENYNEYSLNQKVLEG
ncbi:MAG TPA: adenosylmethionine decarboxylase [Spirochaetota bacterium]|nr:adenosylmethionine decarboxylase [Spirochaetota bacterium]HOM38956.1 adenosylmethionine decarboxylase [Spirochaetota bacterium]HPQ49214.1 adenosylmethionine decarboxylase [Spirochaetota bacterium]